MSKDEVLIQLRTLVDRTSERLQWGDLSLHEAVALIRRTKLEAEQLIPDQMGLYQMIYASRFRRLLEQFVLPRQLNVPINRYKPY